MAPADQYLSITLFGTPQMSRDGQALTGVRRKNRALVYYLAAHDTPLTRDHLLAFFWPDHERVASQQILRTMLHDLRRQLGSAIQAEDDMVGLASDTIVDVRLFSASLHSWASDPQTLATALDAYRGDFLAGFSLPESPQFDDWIAGESEHYRLMAIKGFTALARLYESRRDYASALDALRRALALDALQEDLQREAMRLHYLSGDRAAAVRRFEVLRKLLDEEMGVPPMPETRTLYDAIITDSLVSSPPSPPTSSPVRSSPRPLVTAPLLPFIGRAADLQALKTLASPGKLVFITGEPGIGKTRLAEEFIATYDQGGQRPIVLRSVAYELEQGLPYQPIITALRGLLAQPDWPILRAQLALAPIWLAEAARLLPELLSEFPHIAAQSQPAEEARLWEGLHQFVQALASQRPVLLFFDDLHWADAATVAWLGYVARRAGPSLLLVIAARSVEEQSSLAALLQTLTREDRLAQLSLSTLPPSAMRAIAAQLSPKYATQLFIWMTENAEGHPFFLTELVRYAYRTGILQGDGTLDVKALSAALVLPPTIQNLIHARFIRLREATRHVLHIAAVVGREFDFELVQQASSLSDVDSLAALEELQAVGLVHPYKEAQFTFDHSLTMYVALQDMGEVRRYRLHRKVAEALEQIHQQRLDPVSGRIAHHFVEGRLPARAGPYALRAGRYASGLAAWAEALSFYHEALALIDDETEQAAIHLAIGVATFHKGDFAEASSHYEVAVRLAQTYHDFDVLEAAHVALNQSLMPQARYAEAIALAAELRRAGPPELAVCAEFMWGTALSVASARPIEAEYHLTEARRLLAEQSGFSSHVTEAQITYQLAGVLGQQGHSDRAVLLYRRALELVSADPTTLDLLRNIMLYNNLAYHLNLLGDPSAVDYAGAGIRLAKEKGSLSHLPYLYSTSGEIALAQDDLGAAESYFSQGLSLARQIPVPERIAGLTANLGNVASKRGQKDVALQRLEEARTRADQLGVHHLGARIRIWLAPLLPVSQARQYLQDARGLAEEGGFQRLLDEIEALERSLPPDQKN